MFQQGFPQPSETILKSVADSPKAQHVLNPIIILFDRREATAHGVFCYHTWIEELKEIVWATGFGADTGHLESTERLTFNECASVVAVEVEVTDAEFFPCLFEMLW